MTPHADEFSKFVLTLDIGSTYLKCTIFKIVQSEGTSTNRQSIQKTPTCHPEAMVTTRTATPTTGDTANAVEIDQNNLLEKVLELMKNNLRENKVEWDDIVTVGIASQRNTFLVWNTKTGTAFTPFVSWKDRRGDVIAKAWNNVWFSKLVRTAGKCISAVVSWNRAIIMSAIYFRPGHILPRLSWIRQNVPGVNEAIASGSARIICLDSWLLSELTENFDFQTDFSNVSSWGFFNPATLRWSRPMMWLFRIPRCILPAISSSASNFGSISAKFFGSTKPVTAVVADQQVAAFGHFLNGPGEIKLTLGTGAFITVNSGSKLIFNNEENIYTLIGWKFDDNPPVYLTETCVEGYAEVLFASARRGVNLHSSVDFKPDEIDNMLSSYLKKKENCSPQNDKFFSFQNDEAFDVFIEIAFLIVSRIAVMAEHIPLKFPLRMDGGLSNSKILLRILATLLGEAVARPINCELTSFGTALFAGIGAGLWTMSDVEESSRSDFEIYYPGSSHLKASLVKHRTFAVHRSSFTVR